MLTILLWINGLNRVKEMYNLIYYYYKKFKSPQMELFNIRDQ